MNAPIAVATASFAGLLLFAAADLVIGFRLPGPELDVPRAAMTVAMVFGHCAVVGLAATIGWSAAILIGGIVSAISGRRIDGLYWIAVIVAAAAAILLNRDTFDGPRVRGHDHYTAILWGFRIGAPLSIVVAFALTRAVLRYVAPRRILSILAAFAAAAAALVLMRAHTRYYVGLYPMLHVQLVLGAAVAWILAAALALRGGMKLLGAIVAVAVVGAATAFIAPKLPGYRTAAAAAQPRGPATAEFARVTGPLFRILKAAPVPKARRNASHLEDRASQPSSPEIAAWLEAIPDRSNLNVLFVAMDTVRADRVSFAGYSRKTTKRIDEIAGDSYIFKRAYASYPTSNYSYASLLTGLYPRSTPSYAFLQKSDETFPDELTLPALMSKNGWRSVGVTAFDKQTARDPAWFGLLARGFQVYNPDQTEGAMDAKQITDSAIKALAVRRTEPFFLWAHYIDPHAPYRTWPGHEFGSSISDAYDSEIAWTDAQVGRLLDALRESGEFERTVVVVFSDHGEEFNEHNSLYHNSSLYEQQLHVPLLIRIPGVRGRTIDATVSLTDLFPTLMQIVGVKDPLARHGRSLVDTLAGSGGERPGSAYAEFFGFRAGHRDRDMRMAIVGTDKIIRDLQRDTWEVYDLAKDPLERKNLVGLDDGREANLRGALEDADALVMVKASGATRETATTQKAPTLRDELDAAAAAVMGSDRKAGDAAIGAIQKLLFDYTGDLSPRVVAEAGPKEIDAWVGELIERGRSLKDAGAKNRLMRLLLELKREPARELYVAGLGAPGEIGTRAAAALAALGDGRGRANLVRALETGESIDPRIPAVALARLGDPAARPWIFPTLFSPGWNHVAEMIRALPAMKLPALSIRLREFAVEGLFKPVSIQAVMARSLGATAVDDEGMRWLVLRWANDGDPMIRDAAREALGAARISEKDLESTREAAMLELDGDLALVNGVFDLAFKRWDEALAKTSYLNPGLRLRYARYLHEQGNKPKARELLASVKERAVDPLDREIAVRRERLMEWPARITEADTFAAEVAEFEAPAAIAPNVPMLVRFKLKNTGKIAWQGGYWRCVNRLSVSWVGADGKPLALRAASAAFLPETGVLPGETIDFEMAAIAPDVRGVEAYPVLTLSQPWLKLPDDGAFYRAAKPVTVGVAAPRPGSK